MAKSRRQRARKGSGSILPRGARFVARLDLGVGADGQRISRSKSFATRREAQAWLEQQHSHSEKLNLPVADQRLDEYLRWRLEREAPKGKPGRAPLATTTLLRIHVRAVPDTDLVLVVASDLDPVTRPRQVLIGVLVPVGAIGVVALAVLAWTSTRQALRPLEQMADRAETISGDQLSVRLPVTGAGSELDRLGATINRMVDRLEDHIARERQFTADASHEMRTPLAIMRAELELAETATDEPTRKRLISAREEIDRLATLVDDLLVLARADADQLDTFETVELATLLANVRVRFAPLAARRHIELTAETDGTTYADPQGLDRALSNLVDNALRHTPEGGQVHLSAHLDGDAARLAVTDTGPGVPEGKLDTMFDRFSRLDAARTSGGAGLGLAIVAAVARAHHGTATAHNRPTGGLQIDITLPRHPPR